MKSQVNSSNKRIYSNQEIIIIKLFDKIKSHFMTKENENERKAFIQLTDMCCNHLIRHDNRIRIFRPLSPHLPIYKPQLTSTFPIFHRISGAFLVTIVLFFYLLCLKIGLICFTYENFYQFCFYSSKLILIAVEITALALSYHLYNGVRHLLTDFSGFFFRKKRLK